MTKRSITVIAIITLVAMVFAVAAIAEGPATDAYEALKSELGQLSREAQSTRSMDRRLEIVDTMETKLVAFRGEYPNTPESFDAGFQLGIMKCNMQQWQEAAPLLSEYVVKADAAPPQQIAFAHYYLAECYANLGKGEDARYNYDLILERYGSVNPRLTQAVQAALRNLDTAMKLAIGATPLDFEVKTIEGKTISPSQYKGKVLLIDFWATWCAPCKADMPHVKRVYDKYKDKGFEIVGISLDRSRADLDRYIEQMGIGWPQYFDGKYWQNDIAQMYGVQQIPTTYLIDRDGKIRYKSLPGRKLESAVAKLINES